MSVQSSLGDYISTILYSFAVLGWWHNGALAKLRRAVRYAFPSFAPRDISNVSWAMVTLSHRDDHAFTELMEKVGRDVKPSQACRTAESSKKGVRKGTPPYFNNVNEGTTPSCSHSSLK
eukprot:4570857-Amphidinium_carterae.1